MNSLYKQELLFYYKNQPNRKKLDKKTHSGREVNTSCGDEINVELFVKDGIIKKVGYQIDGCIISNGAASMLSEYLEGKSVKDIKDFSKDRFIDILGIKLTPSREKCALMGYDAVKKALKGD